MLRKIVSTLIVVLCAAAAVAPANAQSVNINVDASTTVAAQPPRSFGFSGNLWSISPAFSVAAGSRVLNMPSEGITRVSLGDTLLQQATSLDDLRQRLSQFSLNDFLRSYAGRGGRVLLILDGTPQWLSSNQDASIVTGPNQPRFRMSPPSDYVGWSEVVRAIVLHFNGKLGLNAYYEAWNEPSYYYYGTTAQFMKQYYYSVVGARRADARALVGGPGISEFIGAGTALPVDHAGEVSLTTLSLQQRFLFKQFLEQAAATPVPELALPRLPVDFFSWHAFHFDPARYYGTVVPYVRNALVQAGYPQSTPMLATEWNIEPAPPYTEGDINANQVDAAYAAASLIAMNEAGVDGQSFQMYMDPVDGYYGGMFTMSGIARANFHAFSLFAGLHGRQVSVKTGDPWVKATAFVDTGKVYVLVASYVPTRKMITASESLVDFLANKDLAQQIVNANLVDALMGGTLPEPYASAVAAAQQATQTRIDAAVALANQRTQTTINLSLAGLTAFTPAHVTRYLIDSTHGNVFPDLATANSLLASALTPPGGEAAWLRGILTNSGLTSTECDVVVSGILAGTPVDQILAQFSSTRRAVVLTGLQNVVNGIVQLYNSGIAAVDAMPTAHMDVTTFAWPSSGQLSITAEPQSVQLFVLTP
ncbi:MAG TPA: hypothetical protein VFP44_04185 [Usitatibacter sp.]|nr:hypothetical protein [Usitatibacter sp.]